jgi:hypothetical protein
VWNLLVSGQLKVLASLTNWFREFRKYHRDDKGSGKIVKRDDHLMDATRLSDHQRATPHAYQTATPQASTQAPKRRCDMVVNLLTRTATHGARLSSATNT